MSPSLAHAASVPVGLLEGPPLQPKLPSDGSDLRTLCPLTPARRMVPAVHQALASALASIRTVPTDSGPACVPLHHIPFGQTVTLVQDSEDAAEAVNKNETPPVTV